jgi:glycosyltransferase involved in cell wall biosynthesis
MLYMRMEKIAVASAVGVNRNIISQGIDGFLVKDDEEWENVLKMVLRKINEQDHIGKNARRKMVSNYSIYKNSDKFTELF